MRAPGPTHPQLRFAAYIALFGIACIAAAWLGGAGEFVFVLGLFLLFLAGGVLNWDRRSGH